MDRGNFIRGTVLSGALAVCAAIFACAVGAAEPKPLWENNEDAAALVARAKATDRRQFAAAVRLRFGESAKTAETEFGLFSLRLTDDRLLQVTFRPERDEIRATPLVLTSTEKIESGRWYDLAVNFTAERRRYTMYLDGKWQMDNAVPHVPDRILVNTPALGDFAGGIARYTVYDMALGSEELTPSDVAADALAAASARAAEIAAAENAALAAWGGRLVTRFGEIRSLVKDGRVSIAGVKRAFDDLAKAGKLLAAAGKDRAFVTYRVNPTSQEMYLPAKLPEDGRVADSLRYFAAKGENTWGSVFVVPLKETDAFTVRFTAFKDGKGRVLPADGIDVKLVKCWFRSGGAWMAYQGDKLSRVLAPDLLLNDERIIRVDEFREQNERLLRLPEGTRYVDVSRNGQDQHEYYMRGAKTGTVPFGDAKTLQPVKMDAVGRGQQYVFLFSVPAGQPDGFYRGGLELVADGKVVETLPVVFRVLPFTLPEARTYYDLNRIYFSHVNLCWGKSRFPVRPQYEVLAKYGFRHPSGILDSEENYRWAKETGMDLTNIMSAPTPTGPAWEKPWGGNARLIPEKDADRLDRIFLETWERQSARFKDSIRGAVLYPVFTSEADHYRAVKEQVDRPENVFHVHTNVKRFSHSMTEKFILGALDGTDMDASAQIHREWAAVWHAAGARVLNYAEPFPSSENPAWFRRKIGLELYKTNYDGHMMHGFLSMRFNEFTDWPEDPAYRNFGMAYYGDGGIIERLCLVGCAEGYNDVRYATELRLLCTPQLGSKDPVVVKEAKRQLAWLEMVDGLRYDMTAFRQGCANRILTMLQLVEARKEVK